jgi:hypothetical protein
MKRPRSRKRSSAPPRNLPGNVTQFTRKVTFNIAKAAADSGRVIVMTLADFASADMVALFGLYKIKSFKVTWRLVNAPNNNATFPTLHVAPQTYSIGLPATITDVQNLTKCTTFQFGPTAISYTRHFSPGIIMDAAGTGTGQVNLSSAEHWLTVFNTAVSHIGCSYWVSRYNTTTDATHTLEYDVEAVLALKATR